MTGKDICRRAAECSALKYWWGGKGELATISLADRLQRENPNVWTGKYYNKAIQDINGKNHVGDCSYLVCHAYDIGMINSYGIEAKFPEWKADPKDGMILWRRGHVGIYDAGRVHELRGIDSDYKFELYKPSSWAKVLYDENVLYDKPKYPIGWNRNMDTGQWWYQYGVCDGDYYKNQIACINGDYYAFAEDGYMIEGKGMFYTDTNGEIVAVSADLLQ